MSTNLDTEIRIKSQLIQKHDLEVNWNKATGFVPYKGQLIVYDIEVDKDGNPITQTVDGVEKAVHVLVERSAPYTYERIKIGDGIKTVSDLPFVDAALRDEIIETYATKAEVAEINTEAIIDVASFPTEDIKEDSFYRVTTGTFYLNNHINAMMVCHIIEELPETGLPTFDYSGSSTEEHLYYRASDDTLWTYMSEEFLQFFQQGNSYIEGCEVGWHRAEPFFAKNDCVYNGTYTDFSAVPSIGYSLVLSQKDLYLYKNGWSKVKFIQTGSDDTAEIFNDSSNQAVGSYTHAEGSGTYAIGGGSHAEGWNTHAGSTNSIAAAHAEGYDTNASGLYSHAEGQNATASGVASHAEGNYTTASGSKSHAEGANTTASGNNSHAEGQNATASGVASHAEGFYAKASGKYAHSEGQQTTASGQSTHAEGCLTVAFGSKSHAEGANTTAFGEASHAEGGSTNSCSSAGVTNSTNNDDILSKWHSKQFSLAKGANSHVEGLNSLALGAQSHAEGAETHAIGDNAHAEGSQTTTVGYNSHAEGNGGIAYGTSSHVEGTGHYTLAQLEAIEGFNISDDTSIIDTWKSKKFSLARGDASHTEGNYCLALGSYSHAEGNSTTASGIDSHAEGCDTRAEGRYSHTEGYGTVAQGLGVHAEGYGSYISSDVDLSSDESIQAAWENTKFSLGKGQGAHVEGWTNLVLGIASHAEGHSNAIIGNYSHAEGSNNTVTHAFGHAEGSHNTVSGECAHAEGQKTVSSGQYSHAEGYYTTAAGIHQHAQGKFNIEDTSNTYAHIVGNGTFTNSRSNAHTLDWEGNAWFAGDIYVGSTSGVNKDAGSKKLATEDFVDDKFIAKTAESQTITGDLIITNNLTVNGAQAEGYQTVASGNYSHAEGYGTIATAQAQHVQGKFNLADTEGLYAHIVGKGTGEDHFRANAHTLDWQGNAWYSGNIRIGGSGWTDQENNRLVATIDNLTVDDHNKILVYDAHNCKFIKSDYTMESLITHILDLADKQTKAYVAWYMSTLVDEEENETGVTTNIEAPESGINTTQNDAGGDTLDIG